jgi:hypothetical protein
MYDDQGAMCPFKEHKYISDGDWQPPSDTEKGDWCPLRPLPEKHGRLGDLDELKASFAESINECKKWIKELEENEDNETMPLANQAFCTFVEAALRLKSIPTIVEAEGG